MSLGPLLTSPTYACISPKYVFFIFLIYLACKRLTTVLIAFYVAGEVHFLQSEPSQKLRFVMAKDIMASDVICFKEVTIILRLKYGLKAL